MKGKTQAQVIFSRLKLKLISPGPRSLLQMKACAQRSRPRIKLNAQSEDSSHLHLTASVNKSGFRARRELQKTEHIQ